MANQNLKHRVHDYIVRAAIVHHDPLFEGTYLGIRASDDTKTELSAWLKDHGLAELEPVEKWHVTLFSTVLYKFPVKASAEKRIILDRTKCRFGVLEKNDMIGLVFVDPTIEQRRRLLLAREAKVAKAQNVAVPRYIYNQHMVVGKNRSGVVERLNREWSGYEEHLELEHEYEKTLRLKKPRRVFQPMVRRDVAADIREAMRRR